MRLNHIQKVKLARKLRTKEEIDKGVWLFGSLNWRKRKWQIMQRVQRQQVRAHYYSELRKGVR